MFGLCCVLVMLLWCCYVGFVVDVVVAVAVVAAFVVVPSYGCGVVIMVFLCWCGNGACYIDMWCVDCVMLLCGMHFTVL